MMDTIKALIEHKKYDAMTEYAKVLHGKDNLVVSEYCGANVRLYKDNDNKVRLLCPKNMTVVQEGHVANAIANGSVFDDADEIDKNAACIERLSIPYDAMVNSGRDVPQNLRPMIAIVVGRMDDNGAFATSDADRTNGMNFVRDLSDAKRNGEKINGVVDNYVERQPEGFYTPEIGKGISKLDKEMDDVNDTDPGNVVSDEDTVDSYDDYDMDAIERDPDTADDNEPVDNEGNNESAEDQLDVDNGEEDAVEDVEHTDDDDNDDNSGSDDDLSEDGDDADALDLDEPAEVDECGNCVPNNRDIVQEEDDMGADTGDAQAEDAGTADMGSDVGEAETVEEEDRITENERNEVEEAATFDQNIKGATETGGVTPTPSPMSAETKAILNNQTHHQEGFLSKKPKKLKPIGRDVVAYITVEMNNIHSANDQAMLAGYTCSKIELVDWYITVIDTQDPKYLVPHTRQYLVTTKAQLESLLAQILKIRPINRSEQIWRVNYPQATY